MNNFFDCSHRVKFDLFRRYGKIAAAGDRHLAEFMPPWYLQNPETARRWGFTLTPVSWRWEDLDNRLARRARLFRPKLLGRWAEPRSGRPESRRLWREQGAWAWALPAPRTGLGLARGLLRRQTPWDAGRRPGLGARAFAGRSPRAPGPALPFPPRPPRPPRLLPARPRHRGAVPEAGGAVPADPAGGGREAEAAERGEAADGEAGPSQREPGAQDRLSERIRSDHRGDRSRLPQGGARVPGAAPGAPGQAVGPRGAAARPGSYCGRLVTMSLSPD